jgi:hypothetical protein
MKSNTKEYLSDHDETATTKVEDHSFQHDCYE